MEEALEKLARHLSRAFWGRIVVRPLSSSRDLEVRDALVSREAKVQPLRAEARVAAAGFAQWRRMEVRTCGAWLGRAGALRVQGGPLADLGSGGALSFRQRVKRVVLGWRLRIPSETERIRLLPQERSNRLAYLKNLPHPEGASLLAAFSPIIEGLVVKSVLDKRSGKLWVWYRSSRTRELPKHLALLRVGADRENPLRWVWLPARKGVSGKGTEAKGHH